MFARIAAILVLFFLEDCVAFVAPLAGLPHIPSQLVRGEIGTTALSRETADHDCPRFVRSTCISPLMVPRLERHIKGGTRNAVDR